MVASLLKGHPTEIHHVCPFPQTSQTWYMVQCCHVFSKPRKNVTNFGTKTNPQNYCDSNETKRQDRLILQFQSPTPAKTPNDYTMIPRRLSVPNLTSIKKVLTPSLTYLTAIICKLYQGANWWQIMPSYFF